jgi:ubiquitin-protein ligase/DNA-directed RNA polymerase subunit RPC12/RpoP
MINFNCKKCGKAFSVQDDLAGRTATCKACGEKLVVPDPRAPAPVAKKPRPAPLGSAENPVALESAVPAAPRATPQKAKLPVRTRRLMADAEVMTKAFRNFPLVKIHKMAGQPPELYQVIYHVRGLTRGPQGQPVTREGHVVEIQLTRDYPRQSPKCRMLTPIFHPNIEPATICVGDHWTASERLVDLVIRIGELITYQAYNIKSPLDGEAAMWADQNAHLLPVDRRDLRPPNLD